MYAAPGGELEASLAIHGLRFGLRAGIEASHGHMATIGLRMRDGAAMFAVDAFLSESTELPSTTSDAGVMVGVGYGPKVGFGKFLGGLAFAGVVALAVLANGFHDN